MHNSIERIQKAISELQNGKMIILTDHADRENEGDLIFPAELCDAEKINFMIKHCSGIICLSLLEAQLKKLGVTYMVPPHLNTSQCKTPFTTTIEAKQNVSTGVSAQDRATTILTAVRDDVTCDDISTPGHIFPLHANAGGVLQRPGHTEGANDLAQLAGFKPAAVLCEIMNPDGTMTKGKQLEEFAKQHDLFTLAIEDIITYRRIHENLLSDEVTTTIPLEKFGSFTLTVVKEKFANLEHMIFESKKPYSSNPLVRIHSACMTGDTFGSARCDCHKQLHYSLEKISEQGGILIYLNQEGRGIGLLNKIKSYVLQDEGMDTVDANHFLKLPVDARDYHIAASILKKKNISTIKLLTNNPHKVENLAKYNLHQVEVIPLPIFANEHNHRYLQTKKEKLHHWIEIG